MKSKHYLLLTVHRVSNTDNLENLKKIINAIGKSGEKTIFPVHPRTEKKLKKIKISKFKNLKIIKPIGYFEMIILEKNAKKILTDSGGVQKEAFWLKVPCITLRDESEWVETMESGWNILTGVKEEKILKAIRNFNPKNNQKKYFGNGNTAKIITKILIEKLNGK